MKEIPLTQGKVALVDDEDFDKINADKWYAMRMGNTWCAARMTLGGRGKRKQLLMHRVIIDAKPGVLVDHWSRDGLDNRRKNLRRANHTLNMANSKAPTTNTSGFKGVHFSRRRGKWIALIYSKGRKRQVGSYTAREDAALAYDKAARELFGEFALTNFADGSSVTSAHLNG